MPHISISPAFSWLTRVFPDAARGPAEAKVSRGEFVLLGELPPARGALCVTACDRQLCTPRRLFPVCVRALRDP